MAESKMNSIGFKKYTNNIIFYGFLCICAFFTLYPIYFSIISSLKKSDDIFLHPFSVPLTFHFENYARAWEIGNIGIYFRNSVVLTLATMIVVIFVGAMAAYVLSRFNFKFQSVLFIFFISGLMIPIQSTIIPLSFIFGNLHIKNNYPVLILLFTAFQIPITVFILNGFMKSIPSELEEAAIIDGCSAFVVFTKIIIPMSMPAIVTASIFNFLNVWNNLLFPLVFISDKNLQVMALGLLSFFSERVSDYSGVMAAIVFSIVPPLLTYVLLQEKVEKGLTAGAVKG